jgi:hypothetical protein
LDGFYKLKSGVMSGENAEHIRSSLMSNNDENVDQLKEPVLQNRRITIHELANMLCMSSGSTDQIWKEDLNINHIAAKSVHKPACHIYLSMNFWLKAKLPPFQTLCTDQTQRPVTSLFSQNTRVC